MQHRCKNRKLIQPNGIAHKKMCYDRKVGESGYLSLGRVGMRYLEKQDRKGFRTVNWLKTKLTQPMIVL